MFYFYWYPRFSIICYLWILLRKLKWNRIQIRFRCELGSVYFYSQMPGKEKACFLFQWKCTMFCVLTTISRGKKTNEILEFSFYIKGYTHIAWYASLLVYSNQVSDAFLLKHTFCSLTAVLYHMVLVYIIWKYFF
jgi:hypothetical protein